MSLTFGFEYEVAENGRAVLDELVKVDAVSSSYLHEYHCRCSECEYDNYGPRGKWLFTAQQDCTVSAEFPSKVLTWGTDTAETAFLTMQRAAVRAGAVLDGDSGMHVHVAKPPTESVIRLDDGDGGQQYLTTRQKCSWRLARLFLRYQHELRDIASGGRDEVRGYNTPMYLSDYSGTVFWSYDLDAENPMVTNGHRDISGSYLSFGHKATFEFRLWNASKSAWRMRLCVAMSVAMVEAAMAGVDVTENDPRPVEQVLAPWLDDTTWAGILRQRFLQGGVEKAA